MIFRLCLSALTTALKKSVGEVELAQVLHDGRLLCKDVGQRDKAMRLTSVCKKEVVGAQYTTELLGCCTPGITWLTRLDHLKRITVGEIKSIHALRSFKQFSIYCPLKCRATTCYFAV